MDDSVLNKAHHQKFDEFEKNIDELLKEEAIKKGLQVEATYIRPHSSEEMDEKLGLPPNYLVMIYNYVERMEDSLKRIADAVQRIANEK